jgi:hypothetical protein
MTSKFCAIVTFVTVDSHTTVHIKLCAGMFVIYHHTGFQMPSYNSSLVITKKLKANSLCVATVLFYILQKNRATLMRAADFERSVITKHHFMTPTSMAFTAASASQVHLSVMLLLLIAGI